MALVTTPGSAFADSYASLADADNTAAAPTAELELRQREHEATAAALALGETDAGTAKQTAQALAEAQRAVNEARERADAAAATRAGLARRLADAEAAVIAAAAELEAADRAYLWAEFEKADTAFTDLVQPLFHAIARNSALRAALATRGEQVPRATALPDLLAIGPLSAAAVMKAHPTEPHGWTATIHPRFDASAARSLIEAELAALREAPAGLVSRAAAAVRKATA